MRYIIVHYLILSMPVLWAGCQHAPTENTQATTFVLSDDYLKNISIDTCTMIMRSPGHEISVIPCTAVIHDKGKNYAIIFRDKFNISVREVKVDTTVNGIAYISSGLLPGEIVISTNQLKIYDALKE